VLAQGTIVAGYRVDGVLGEGGMGTVYRATQLSLNRVVALKLLAQELSDDAGFRSRFEREGQLQAGLDHQHIVTVYEAGQTEHGLFLAMRLIAGPTLKELILGGQLTARRALRILAQVANALDEAHAAGLIHRDVKPHNILIGRDDHTYLCDFGLIKSPDDSESLTGTGQFMGTIDYVSPEQIQGEPATAASDCYSLCAVLFESLTGQVPFLRPNEAATLHAQVVTPPPKATDLRPELPPAIDAVIAAGMAKDPAARPASAAELIRDASAALSRVELTSQDTRISPGAEGLPAIQGTRQADVVATAASAVPIREIETTRASAVIPPAEPTRLTAPAPPAEPAAESAPAGPAASTRASEQPRREGGSWSLRAAVFVLAAAAIAAGILVGHSATKHRTSQAQTSSAVAGPLRLRYPSAWQLSDTVPALPGTTFASPIVISAPAPAAGTVEAGVVTGASGPSLLAPGLRSAVTGGPPVGQMVRLAKLGALRYGPMRVNGVDGTVTIYVVPTSAGVATIACISAQSAFDASCEHVAATSVLVGAVSYPLGPNPAYAQALSGAIARLNAAVAAPLAALGSARAHGAQAAAAHRLAVVYTGAAGDIARLTASPRDGQAGAALAAALRQLAAGYSQAATAAAHTNAAGYSAAGRQLRTAAAALQRALQALSALGYPVARS
jgi:hypothetical protein